MYTGDEGLSNIATVSERAPDGGSGVMAVDMKILPELPIRTRLTAVDTDGSRR